MGDVCFCNTIQIQILSFQKAAITNKLNLCATKKMLCASLKAVIMQKESQKRKLAEEELTIAQCSKYIPGSRGGVFSPGYLCI